MKIFLISTFVLFTLGPRKALSSGFEVDYFKAPSNVKLLANFRQDVKLYFKNGRSKICQKTVNHHYACGQSFEYDSGGQIYLVEETESFKGQSKAFPVEISQDDQNKAYQVSVRGLMAKKIINQLTESLESNLESTEYKKITREGIDIKCYSVLAENLKKYSCKLALSQQFLPRK